MLLFLLRADKRLRLQILTFLLIGADIFSFNVEGGRCYSCESTEQCFYPNNELAKKEDCDTDFCWKAITYPFNSPHNYIKGCVPKNETLRAECVLENFADKEGCFFTGYTAQDEIIIPCIQRKLASSNKASEGEDEKIRYIPATLCHCKGDLCNDGGIPGNEIPIVETTPPPPPPQVYGRVECFDCGSNSSNVCEENPTTWSTNICRGTYCYQTYQGSSTGWDTDESKPDDSRPRRGCFSTAALEYLQEKNPDRCHNLSPDDFRAIESREREKSKQSYVDGQELSFNLTESKLSKCVCQADHCNNQEIKSVRRCYKCEVETQDERQTYFEECHGGEGKNLVECSSKYCLKRTTFEGSPATWFSETSKKFRIKFGCLNGSYHDEERAFQCTEKNKAETKWHTYGCQAFESVQACVGNGMGKRDKPTKECICAKDGCNDRGGKLNGGDIGLITFLICFGWIYFPK